MQSQQLIQTLKRQLKAQGITYRQVADALALSEASVKRLLASGQISLQRLESIADLAGLSLGELVQLAQHEPSKIQVLTIEQEHQIANDIVLMMVTISVLSGFTFDELVAHYALEKPVLIQKLAQLDRLRLLELLPNNRIRLRIAPTFHWQANGPIQQFFLRRVAADFLASQFDKDTERLIVHNGLCSAATNHAIQTRMVRFVQEIALLIEDDKNVPLARKHGNTLVLALRQWQFGEFKALSRQKLDA